MEEFVQLNLKTYVNMLEVINRREKENIELKQELNDEKEDKQRIINKAEAITKKLREYIMKQHLTSWVFDKYQFEEIIDFDSYEFAISNKSKLLELGITKEEMVDYVKEAYAKWEETIEE